MAADSAKLVESYVFPASVMATDFPNWLYSLIFAGAALASAGSVRFWTERARAWGLLDQPGHRKIHANPIPLAGGLIVTTGLLAPLFFAIVLMNVSLLGDSLTALSTYGLEQRSLQLGTLITGAVGLLILGIVDDLKALSAVTKFGIQFLIATAVTLTGTRITLFMPEAIVSYAITILWILTLVNAFNFTDNMNGLCTGLATISAFVFGIHAALPGHYLVASLGFLIAGALAGFLPFNFPKARAFLGDSGSHLTGYLIAVLGILPHYYHEVGQSKIVVVSPLLIVGGVLADMVWIVAYRLRHKRPLYIGDTNHLSHQLVKKGFTEQQSVKMLWLLHALIAVSSFLLL
ncbi:MAG: putative undecaprenyl-phosphate N-acetylglucosaminyl 1-phosphate transferase [Verrucomicrobia subdivision 3 bacterium]|nr:putative undecaprenyl-phosphate N-acetylglucosaminyl 1-phosphate transferase [Limisphaerales bacterium]MCS1413058.1 putative undecaprenyl-phosphate N-acetylglucosaminyl 1-phosphate transferase [Limisphaerales bacterium]